MNLLATADSSLDATWLGIGAALLVAVAAGLWRLAGLRGEVSDRWADRVEIAQAGIGVRAGDALQSLRDDTSRLLGTVEDFDPLNVVEDPATLRGVVKEVLRLFKLLDRLPERYLQLLRLGPHLMTAVGVVGISIILLFGRLGDIIPWSWASPVGMAMGVGSVVVVVVGFLRYAYLEHYLSVAETESRPPPSPRG